MEGWITDLYYKLACGFMMSRAALDFAVAVLLSVLMRPYS